MAPAGLGCRVAHDVCHYCVGLYTVKAVLHILAHIAIASNVAAQVHVGPDLHALMFTPSMCQNVGESLAWGWMQTGCCQ